MRTPDAEPIVWIFITEYSGEIQAIASSLGVVVAIFAAFFVLRSLGHFRSEGFTTAYANIARGLQDVPEVIAGRTILRRFGDEPQQTWPSKWDGMRDDFFGASWYREIDDKLKVLADPYKIKYLEGLMLQGYRALDLAGILTLNSHIPGLPEVVAIEWADSIVGCWENGRRYLKGRKGRFELFQCFSVLYVLAKRRLRRSVLPGDLYPATSTAWHSIPLASLIAARRARSLRHSIASCNCEQPCRCGCIDPAAKPPAKPTSI